MALALKLVAEDFPGLSLIVPEGSVPIVLDEATAETMLEVLPMSIAADVLQQLQDWLSKIIDACAGVETE